MRRVWAKLDAEAFKEVLKEELGDADDNPLIIRIEINASTARLIYAINMAIEISTPIARPSEYAKSY